MTVLTAIAGCVGEVALIWLMVILYRLSAKFGEVRKMRPYHRGYYAAGALVGVALATRFLRASLLLSPTGSAPPWLGSWWFDLVLHHAMLAIGLALAIPITLKYWGWLVRE